MGGLEAKQVVEATRDLGPLVFKHNAENVRTIDQLAAKYGLTFRTLRFYEQLELLQPQRAGLRRLYTARDEVRLQIILKGRQLGFSLREIKVMMDGPLRETTCNDFVRALTERQITEQLRVLERQRDEICEAINELNAALRWHPATSITVPSDSVRPAHAEVDDFE